jgi:co-chaperonin GroES (HSP10)
MTSAVEIAGRRTVRPLNDVVVVKQDTVRGYTGLIVLPPVVYRKDGRLKTEDTATGIVLKVGPGREKQKSHRGDPGSVIFTKDRKPIPVQVGDHILFLAKYDTDGAHPAFGRWVDSEHGEVILLHAFDIIGWIC